MPSISVALVERLRHALQLKRAVETGTYMGDGARVLAAHFPEVVTIELSPELYRQAKINLADIANVEFCLGHSVSHLSRLAEENQPSLYFLDGHWSAGTTAGEGDECPVLREIGAIGPSQGNAIVVDDARLFAASPPAPHDRSQWPTLIEVIDALRVGDRYVTVIDDRVIATPLHAKAAIDQYGQEFEEQVSLNRRGALERVRERLLTGSPGLARRIPRRARDQ